MNPQKKPESQGILLIRPTLKIAGGSIAVCRIDQELNETEVRQLDVTGAPDHEWPGLFKLIEKELAKGRRLFILDLQKVLWMNSRGLGRLIEMWKLIGDAGGQAVLVCTPGRILTILEISQVNLIMNPVLTLNEAVQALDEKTA
ncbi:MAG: STAS domain-containing protein [Candidatus Krumholzibacteria bacterium]|nr:STAS domain-containing protein [Candidatus Krumholzibacteria bacterium]